jgi:hypothetical protein
MKIKGKKIKGANIEYVVIPRPDGPIVFKAVAVLNMKPFNDLVPEPKPRMRMKPGGLLEPDPDDKAFAAALGDYSEKRFNFILLESLKESEIEWETVVYTDPNTWKNYEQELRDADFTTNEINMIISGVATANSLNDAKLKEARDSFLASLAAIQQGLSSQTEEQSITLFGEVAKDSESGPQES